MAGIRRIGGGFELDNVATRFEVFKRTAPRVIAEQSKNHFLEGFRKGGGQTNDSKSGWQARKGNKDPGRAVLIGPGTGHLWRDIAVLKATWQSIIIGNTIRIPYADRHNEGITDKLGRAMPKREFIGDSDELDKKNKDLITRLIMRVFRGV